MRWKIPWVHISLVDMWNGEASFMSWLLQLRHVTATGISTYMIVDSIGKSFTRIYLSALSWFVNHSGRYGIAGKAAWISIIISPA